MPLTLTIMVEVDERDFYDVCDTAANRIGGHRDGVGESEISEALASIIAADLQAIASGYAKPELSRLADATAAVLRQRRWERGKRKAASAGTLTAVR